jgi:hypothetical protein
MKLNFDNGHGNVYKIKGFLYIRLYDCDIIILKMKYDVEKITLKKGTQENAKFI